MAQVPQKDKNSRIRLWTGTSLFSKGKKGKKKQDEGEAVSSKCESKSETSPTDESGGKSQKKKHLSASSDIPEQQRPPCQCLLISLSSGPGNRKQALFFSSL